MKIFIICNCSSGLYNFRGLLIKSLIDRGNTIYATVPKTNDEGEKIAENNLVKLGCDLINSNIDRRGINPIKDLRLIFQYLTIVKKEKPDLIITYTIKPNIYGGIASRITRTPYVVNITGLGTAFEGNGLVKKVVCCLYKTALKQAKVVFFENVGNKDTIVELGLVEENKTKVLAGAGVDLEHFKYIEYPKETKETKFLFIGRVMKEKGIDELLQAMKRLVDEGISCTLDIVGGYEEDYSNIFKEYEKEGWLHYYGGQSDVRPFIANCNCFVLPSWHEGMANTNLECAASGRPIITSNIHGCLEAVIDGETGYLVEVKNVDSLYETMKKFINISYEKKVSMGKLGRKHMENVFDKMKVVDEKINSIYEE